MRSSPAVLANVRLKRTTATAHDPRHLAPAQEKRHPHPKPPHPEAWESHLTSTSRRVSASMATRPSKLSLRSPWAACGSGRGTRIRLVLEGTVSVQKASSRRAVGEAA